MYKCRTKRITALLAALTLVLTFAGCKSGDSFDTTTELTTEYVTQNQTKAYSEYVSDTYSETENIEPAAPAATGDVVISSGTRGGVLTFHMNNGTYDLYVPKYYLSTADIPALKTLLKLKPLIPKEAKPYVTKENGYDAIGPVEIAFKGDTFSVSDTTLTFGNKKTARIELMPDWGDLPFGTPAATASSSGLTVTFIIKGDGGKYDCPISTFNLTADECRAIGLAV